MTTATGEKALLEGIISSLRKALEQASPNVFAALRFAEMRLAQIKEEE